MGENRRQQPSMFRSLLGQAQSPAPPKSDPALSMQCPLPAPAQDPLEHRSLKTCPSPPDTLQAQASPRSALITPSPAQASGTLLLSLLPNMPTRLLPPRWCLSVCPLTSREHMLRRQLGLVGGRSTISRTKIQRGILPMNSLTPLSPGSSDYSPLRLQAPGRPDRRGSPSVPF